MKRLLIIGSSVLGAMLLLGIIAWFWLQSMVTNSIVKGLAESLNAEVKFDDIHLSLFDGNIIGHNGNLRSNNLDTPWSEAQIGIAEVDFKFWDLFGKTTPISLNLDTVRLVLGHPSGQAPVAPTLENPPTGSAPNSSTTTSSQSSWPHIEITKFQVKDGIIAGDNDHPIQSNNLNILMEKTNVTNTWNGAVSAQKLTLFTFEFGSSQAHFSLADQQVHLADFKLLTDTGFLSGHADFPQDLDQPGKLHLDFNAVPVGFLIPAQWSMMLLGNAQGAADYDGPFSHPEKGHSQGHIQLQSAELKAIPFLAKLSIIPGLSGLADIALDTAETDFASTNGILRLSNLNVEKYKLISFKGDIAVDTLGNLDGLVKMGLPGVVVGVIPKLKETIFTTDDDYYSYADVKISGTTAHMEEDLVPRVLALMKDQGANLLQQTMQGAGSLFNSFMGK